EAGLRPDGIALKELYLDEENVLAEEVTPRYPARFSLSSAFPNPFNGEVRFELSVPAPEGGRPSRLGVEVFDLLGRRVAVILKGALPPGVHRLSWSGTDSAGRALPSGLYFVRARYGKQIQMRKVLLVR
ncbi:MAG TPA: T9SS type A sorting domain-containing protein, partial [Bacteroidetes bacterium]|nr:T9SS type A sorting domain-containing protein [Bacteroidota bacterium]